MDFRFNEEQILIQQTFQKFCEKELNYEYVRWMDENVDFPPDELWQKFVDIGHVLRGRSGGIRRAGPGAGRHHARL